MSGDSRILLADGPEGAAEAARPAYKAPAADKATIGRLAMFATRRASPCSCA